MHWIFLSYLGKESYQVNRHKCLSTLNPKSTLIIDGFPTLDLNCDNLKYAEQYLQNITDILENIDTSEYSTMEELVKSIKDIIGGMKKEAMMLISDKCDTSTTTSQETSSTEKPERCSDPLEIGL